MKKIKFNLGPVQETLLIPLLGRAVETKRGGLVCDTKAVEMVESLDYDFSKWSRSSSLLGACIRTRMFDEEVLTFMDRFPLGSVIELGVGLNTRYERLHHGQTHWLELDLPDSLALRRRFFEETDYRRMVAGTLFDTCWFSEVARLPGPYCFVSEAALIYLNSECVESCLRAMVKRFPGSTLITDTTAAYMVESQDKHDAMKELSSLSWFRWRCDRPELLSDWGLELERSRTFLDAPREVLSGLPRTHRMMFRFLPGMLGRKIRGYKINRFFLRPPPESSAVMSFPRIA